MAELNTVKVNHFQRPVNLLEIANRGQNGAKTSDTGETSFKQMFSQEMADSRSVSFSRHASERLFSRGIQLTDEQVDGIASAIDKAAAKGSRETLILMDDAALIVSVQDRTVVTAFDREHMREGIVTSIDSAAIL